jgi:hypothetical protein
MKIARAFMATLLFACSLALVYYAHMAYFRVNVVFYAAIADAMLAVFFAGVVLFSVAYFQPLSRFEKSLLIIIWLLAGYAFAISVPTVIDRSLSFYILEKLEQRGGGIELAHFEEVFTQEYVKEHRLVDVRLTEQLVSGTIVIDGGCVKLTEKGRNLAAFSKWYRTNFLPRQRLLMGEYSADLTNPFSHSEEDPGYACQ